MGQPSEPLLPVEPDPPSKRRLWIPAAGVALLVAGAATIFLLRKPEAPPPGETAPAPPESGASRPVKPETTRKATETPRAEDGEEAQARELYLAAEAFERAEPAEYEKRMTRWREVVTRHPTSTWARKADEKHRAAAASLQALLDREFEGTRKDAAALAAAGHFVDAIETLQQYRTAQTREILKRRAEVEISGVENASRLAYNEVSSKARELTAKGDYAGAIPLFEAAARSGIPEVAARCQKSIAQLKDAAAERERFDKSKLGEDARRSAREDLAPKVLDLVRSRHYDEALKELSTAVASPAYAPIRDEIAAERASLADASAFWEAFLKGLRGRSGQDATLLLIDGKKVAGKIVRVQEEKVLVDQGDASTETPLEKIHADQLVGWTVGKTLAAEDGVTYVKAAMFFFCEGRDDLARLYLATARELNGPADAAEKTFRGGFLRAALAAKK